MLPLLVVMSSRALPLSFSSVLVAKHPTSGASRGVIVGFGTNAGNAYAAAPLGADPDGLGITQIPATKTKAYFVWVCDDPTTVFEAQADTIAATAFNKNCPLYVGAAPASPIFNSLSYAQGSAANTTQALPLKIVGARESAG
ncbi:MAG: hypothetical protein IPJ48_18360 [Propionivibrio sp.]|uniref:Uncharacterized protein n=1 Tax=Candidatus Propionivibrio dominans TaxID=2954373 RepID=A0A9D7IA66_9RHOO|nr:hypothetical protein [Candidatus Propionivibrio dominans]